MGIENGDGAGLGELPANIQNSQGIGSRAVGGTTASLEPSSDIGNSVGMNSAPPNVGIYPSFDILPAGAEKVEIFDWGRTIFNSPYYADTNYSVPSGKVFILKNVSYSVYIDFKSILFGPISLFGFYDLLNMNPPSPALGHTSWGVSIHLNGGWLNSNVLSNDTNAGNNSVNDFNGNYNLYEICNQNTDVKVRMTSYYDGSPGSNGFDIVNYNVKVSGILLNKHDVSSQYEPSRVYTK